MRKIYYLDGLRGLAALLVFISHFLQVFYPSVYTGNINSIHTNNNIELILYKTPLNLITNANFFVCIFFVLSGYVLSFKFFIYKDKNIIISSAIRRYMRLAIPVSSSLIFCFVLMKFHLFFLNDIYDLTQTTIMNRYKIQLSLLSILKQSFISIFLTNINTYNASLWTIKYEFIGSYIIFAIMLLLGKSRIRYIFYILFSILFVNTYYLGFILGMSLADIHTNFNSHTNLPKTKKIIILCIALFLGSYPYCKTTNTIYNIISIKFFSISYFTFYHTIAAFLLLFTLINSYVLRNFFQNRIFVFLGKISFSLYLIHFPIINSLSCYIFKSEFVYLSYNVASLLTFIISIVLLIILSYLIYKFIDLNGIAFSKLIYKKLSSNKAQYVFNSNSINIK